MNRRLFIITLLVAVVAMSFSFVLAQDTPPRGGTVVVSTGDIFPYTPLFHPQASQPMTFTTSGIYEPLVLFNPVEGGAPTYWLATNYEYSEDLMSITFTLREGVKWSDGEDFNADDVIFTYEMFRDFPALDRAGIVPYIDSVEKVDDYTVKFNLNQVFTQIHTQIGGMNPVPEHIWKDVEDPVTFTNPEPVATGPLLPSTVNSEVLEYCRNPNYWQLGEDGLPLPYFDCIRMPHYTGNDPANLSLINGELDWIGNFIPDIDNAYVAQDPEHYGYYFWPGGAVVQFYVNTTKAPFDDVTMRRAMSMAIDYDSVTSIGMYGYTEPSNAVGMGPRYETWFNQEALDLAAQYGQTTYDPDGAAALLDQAGYVDADGDGWRDMPDGSPLEFKAQVVSGWTDWVTSVQIITQNFQDIGLNAVMETPEFGTWLQNLESGTFDTSIGWGTAGNTPWDYFRALMSSDFVQDDGKVVNQLWGRWTSEETDALINDFVRTVDADEQHSIINQLQMAYVENVVAIPLFPGPTWYEYTTLRFTGWPTQDDYYAQGSPWEGNSRLIVMMRLHCVDDMSCGQGE